MGTSDRPTTEVANVILASMDRMFGQLLGRLEGLTADEYLWEPVEGMWSVRATDAAPIIDGAGVREIDPAPITTIAWRLWHIAIDCFDDYTRRLNGNDDEASDEWTLNPEDAIAILQQKWDVYRSTIARRGFLEELGPDWEHWSTSSVADMAMHASNEMVHHAAEIGLLRDLYRWQT
jgi:hypothetical protein